jgi:hypothetical protein
MDSILLPSPDFTSLISSSESESSSAFNAQQNELRNFYETFSFEPAWIQQGLNSKTFDNIAITTSIQIFNEDEVPLCVQLFNSDSKMSDFTEKNESPDQKRRGRRRKDWAKIEKNLPSIKSDSEEHRKLKNNISSAQYRLRKSKIAFAIKDDCEKYQRENLELKNRLTNLQNLLEELKKIEEPFDDLTNIQMEPFFLS